MVLGVEMLGSLALDTPFAHDLCTCIDCTY